MLDSSSSGTRISHAALPPGVKGKTVEPIQSSTLAGLFKSNQEVELVNAIFPEFHRTCQVDLIKARIFHTPICYYVVIISRDILSKLGFIINFNNNVMEWDKVQVLMCPYPEKESKENVAMYFLQDSMEDDFMVNQENDKAFQASEEIGNQDKANHGYQMAL